jgi:predicted metal-dependent phosphoesterase TrpH
VTIDLHTHSTVSDGTDSPTELMAAAARVGLHGLALTDHDTTAGWGEATDAARRYGVVLVPGVELTCDGPHGQAHLLGYLVDPQHPELVRQMAWTRDDRVPRMEEMVRRLAAAGYPVTMADVLEQAARTDTTLGRPHLADALVAAGAFPDRATAFAEVLNDRTPYFVGHYAVDPLHGVQLIRAAGGVPVLAHPRGRRVQPDSLIEEMVHVGLVGLEVDHPEHNQAARESLRALARTFDLLVTAGSDYHGAGKPARLGDEGIPDDELDALLARATGPTRAVLA